MSTIGSTEFSLEDHENIIRDLGTMKNSIAKPEVRDLPKRTFEREKNSNQRLDPTVSILFVDPIEVNLSISVQQIY